MSVISSITRYAASGLSRVTATAAKQFAQATGKALKVTRNVSGLPVTTYLKTGTQIAKNIDVAGTKVVKLGAGNRLSQYLKEFTVYPKGSIFGGEEGMILVDTGKKYISRLNGIYERSKMLSFTPKEFGEYIKFLKEMAKIK